MKDNFLAGVTGNYSVPLWLRVVSVSLFAASVMLSTYFGATGSQLDVTLSRDLLVRPPSWMFGIIWPVIYLVYAAALIYIAITDKWPSIAYWATIGISILNALWIWLFSLGTNGALLGCLFTIIALVSALYTLWTMLYDSLNDSFVYYFGRNAVSLYMGWVLVATLLNLGIVLVHTFGLSQKSFTIIFWIAVPLLFLLVTWIAYSRENRNGLKSLIGFWLGGIWGMSGALVSTMSNKFLL